LKKSAVSTFHKHQSC